MKKSITLRRVNNMLTVVVIALAMYIFILPFLPTVSWWVQYQAPVVATAPSVTLKPDEQTPRDNTLIIPKLGISEAVHEGTDERTLSKGIWHIPHSSSPNAEGNTIVAGHRFTYAGKAVFYNLDKLKSGDNVYLYWEGKRYDYIVTATNVVAPTNTTLVSRTDTPTLTIYTCTPLWSAKDRLVITAKLVEVQE